MIRDATGNKEYEFGDGSRALSEASKEAAEKAATAVLDAGGTAVEAWVERFDRRGTEPFELFRSEFGQNSCKIQEFSLEKLNKKRLCYKEDGKSTENLVYN